jgi:hypothetical protein
MLSSYVGTPHEDYAIDVVKHEYGHTKQFDQMGAFYYFVFFGIPSMANGNHPDYYNQLWEVTADMYGGVNVTRTPDSRALLRGKTYLAVLSYFYGRNNLFGSIKCMLE